MDIGYMTALFFVVAMVYASAGFGGGSSYLAIMALFGLPYPLLRPLALCCNLVVVSASSHLFYRAGQLSLRQAFPFVVTSVPAALLGGMYPLHEQLFFVLLGVVLFLTGIVMLFERPAADRPTNLPPRLSLFYQASVGAGIGALSGLVGIGGGIFLSPYLHLTRWGNPKKIAALAAFFILVNSVAGLLGLLVRGTMVLSWYPTLPLMAAAFAGGQLGARIGIFRLPAVQVKRVTAVLILIVAVRILLKQFYGN